jgi:hypothetical protein
VSREDFRRDLRGAFESISGPSSPSLSARVHEALVDAPERRGPVWLAGLAVAVIAVILVGVLFVAGPLSHRQIIPVIPGSSPSPSAQASPSASPSPAPSPSADASGPAFVCNSTFSPINSQGSPAVAYVDAVRVGTHQGYDRITIEFKNGVPSQIEIRPQGNATFTQGASGQTVVLLGSKGLLIVLHGADEHTDYAGATDFKTGYQGMQEARQVEDFEGVVQWALGTSSTGCYRAFLLTNPNRLVIDVQTS